MNRLCMISMPNQDGPMGTSRIKAKWWFWCARYKVRRKDFQAASSYVERSQSLFPNSAIGADGRVRDGLADGARWQLTSGKFGLDEGFDFVPDARIVLDLDVRLHEGSCVPWVSVAGDRIFFVG
jgi:hypothetical protein